MPADLPPWSLIYLTKLAETGAPMLSASTAGVSRRVVRQLQESHAGFAEAIEDSRDHYLDTLETGLPDSKAPIGRIARLKADRANRYETALIVANVTNNHNSLTVAPAGLDPTGFLRACLADATPATLALLAGRDAPPPLRLATEIEP